MPISKFYFFIFSLVLASAQQIEIKLKNDLYSKGEWGSYYILNSDGSYNHYFNIVPVDSVHLISNGDIYSKVFVQLFDSIKGLYGVNQVNRQLNYIEDAYPFLQKAFSVSFAKFGNEKVAAIINLNPNFKSHLGGLLGASRDNKGKWITTGEFDLRLENIRNRGNSLDLVWRQPDARSRFINFSYETPNLISLPFGSIFTFHQEFYEKTFFINSNSLFLTLIGPLGQWKIGGKAERSEDLHLNQRFKSKLGVLGLKGDRRNNRWLPYRGSFWEWNLSYGKLNDFIGNAQVAEFYMSIGKYKSLNNSVMFMSFLGQRNWVDNRNLSQSKVIRFGGSKLLRGYHDNQFYADWVFIQSTEWIFGPLDRTQLFLFADMPFTSSLKIMPGYGLGIRQYNGSLSYNISLGFPGRFSDGKIHISFTTDL